MSIEINIQNDYILFSTTDLEGFITSASDHFLEVSGYSREEMIGQPHNILRHPDVPKQVFADMWATIQSKQSWTGIVKNKTKQGNYYYVQANVSPIIQHDTIIGYVSIRTPADAKAITATNRIYADIAKGKKRIVNSVIHTRWQRFSNFFQLNGSLTKTLTLSLLTHLTLALIIISALFYHFQLSNVEPKALSIEERAISQHINHLMSEKIEGVKNIAMSYASRPNFYQALVMPTEENLKLAQQEIASLPTHFASMSDHRRLRASLLSIDGQVLTNSYETEPTGTASFSQLEFVAQTYQGVGGLSWGANDIGFGVSGYGPIFNDEGQLLGAIVVSGGLGSMARALRKQSLDWLLVLDANMISASNGTLPASLLDNQKIGKQYILANNHWFEKSMLAFVSEHQDRLKLDQTSQGTEIFDNYIISQIPMLDDKGEVIGWHIFKQDNSAILQQLEQEKSNVILFLTSISLAMLIIVGLSIYSLYRRVVLPIKRATILLEKTSKTQRFDGRIVEFDHGDEVSRIFQAYNQQSNTLQQAFSQINDLMNAVQRGDYSQRIETNLNGDLRRVNDSINDAIKSIELRLSNFEKQRQPKKINTPVNMPINKPLNEKINKTITDNLIMAHQLLNQLEHTNKAVKLIAKECQGEFQRSKELSEELNKLIQQIIAEKNQP